MLGKMNHQIYNICKYDEWKCDVVNKILALREKYDLSRADLEEKYNIPQKTLYNWETGLRKCPDYVINLLERAIVADYDTTKEDTNTRIELFLETRENPEKDMDRLVRIMEYIDAISKNKSNK